MSQGKATFAATLSHKCLVATREGESHFMNRKVLLLYFFCIQISQICTETKAMAITPHFVRYAIPTGRTISNKVWVVIAIIRFWGMREPECRIICNHFPHLFSINLSGERGKTGKKQKSFHVTERTFHTVHRTFHKKVQF